MAHTPPEAHSVFQGIACPECGCPESHIQDVYTGVGLHAFGRSDERVGTKTLLACERGHAYVIGLGEHKGGAFMYARLPLGGEVVSTGDYYSGAAAQSDSFRFSGRAEPSDWHPKANAADGEQYPMGNFAAIDSRFFA